MRGGQSQFWRHGKLGRATLCSVRGTLARSPGSLMGLVHLAGASRLLSGTILILGL